MRSIIRFISAEYLEWILIVCRAGVAEVATMAENTDTSLYTDSSEMPTTVSIGISEDSSQGSRKFD